MSLSRPPSSGRAARATAFMAALMICAGLVSMTPDGGEDVHTSSQGSPRRGHESPALSSVPKPTPAPTLPEPTFAPCSASSRTLVVSETDEDVRKLAHANRFSHRDFQEAKAYRRQCSVVETYPTDTVGTCVNCDRLHGFLHPCQDSEMLQPGIYTPPNTSWTRYPGCAWGFSKSDWHDPNAVLGSVVNCSASPCACWVHSTFRRGGQLAPRFGPFLKRWTDVPTPDALFGGTAWFAGLTKGRKFLFAGHSHQRYLFLHLVAMLATVRRDVRLRRTEDWVGDMIATATSASGGTEAVAAFLASPAVGRDDFVAVASGQRFGDAFAAPNVVVVGRGMWDLRNGESTPAFVSRQHTLALVSARDAFPDAVILNYAPHFTHVPSGGCFGLTRQIVLRDAIRCAVAGANTLLKRQRQHLRESRFVVEWFDVFDMTATLRVEEPAGDPAFHSRSVLPTRLGNESLAAVGDGHHYGTQALTNIVVAALLQVSKSPLFRLTPSASKLRPMNDSSAAARPTAFTFANFSHERQRLPEGHSPTHLCTRCYNDVGFMQSMCDIMRGRLNAYCTSRYDSGASEDGANRAAALLTNQEIRSSKHLRDSILTNVTRWCRL